MLHRYWENQMKLFHFTTARYVISSILENRFKLSTFMNLNDPFEVMPIMREKDGHYASAVLVRHHIQDMLKNTGLLCLSADISSTAMWGHYADRHKGVAYEFHFEQEVLGTLFHVEYKNERVELSDKTNLNIKAEYKEFIITLLGRKAECWGFEAEFRWVFPLINGKVHVTVGKDGFIYMAIPKELKRIILGVDCPLIEGVVSNALHEHGFKDVAVTRARLSDRDYRVIVDPI